MGTRGVEAHETFIDGKARNITGTGNDCFRGILERGKESKVRNQDRLQPQAPPASSEVRKHVEAG
jgi:hypothetical protein